MKQKQNLIILGAIGIFLLLFWVAVITFVLKNISGAKQNTDAPVVVDMTLCDEDASNLCVVTFEANNLNRMVINFKLPDKDYVPFYVKAANRGTVNVYTCKVTEAAPTSAYCSGVRTPLGETIDIEVYTTDGDTLIARGTFLISAIALSTPISLPAETAISTDATIPSDVIPTDVPFPTDSFIPTDIFIIPTETPAEEETPTEPPISTLEIITTDTETPIP